VWDPATGVFSPAGSLAEARHGHSASVLPDGRVLVVGGLGEGGVLASSEVWDPSTGSFGPVRSPVAKRVGQTASVLADGRVLVVGGVGGTGVLASAEVWEPTPTRAPTIRPTYFGSGVKVKWYRVTGDDPNAISESILAHGPRMRWLGGAAEALTSYSWSYDYRYRTNGTACRITSTKSSLKMTVTLPQWSPTSKASTETIAWWIDELHDVAAHEKEHVLIDKRAAATMRRVLASSTCSSIDKRVKAVWRRADHRNCEFDMREYGTSEGLSMQRCLHE
jgi:predicted secreted Zn-dependent protease